MDALPDIASPIIDPATGRISPEWYRYLKQLDAAVRGLLAGG